MRFENSAAERLRVNAFQLYDLGGRRESADDSNRRNRHVDQFGEEPADRLIGLPVCRRRGHIELPRLTELPGEAGPARSGANLKRESRSH